MDQTKKVILFGCTGNLGKQLAAELTRQGYDVTGVVRNKVKAQEMQDLVKHTVIAAVTDPASLEGICHNFPTVISALGKSVSPKEKSKPSFWQIDYEANNHILSEALKSGVEKFVYVSALGAENYPHLAYFEAHHRFAEKLKVSGINYSIIKPPALFSAFLDLVDMAKKGQLITMGKGDKRTNPIYEGDLAKICVASINMSNVEIEAGGTEVWSRHQINEIIQQAVNPAKKVRKVPFGLVKAGLPLVRLASGNLYDKMAFFTQVMQHDVIAPKVGETKLRDYVKGNTRYAKSTENISG
jgi:uncharacterized protein YbjT (DUF2867 family)